MCDDLLLNFFHRHDEASSLSWNDDHRDGDRAAQRQDRTARGRRNLQPPPFEIPDYTSPPLPDALAATPAPFRSDTVIDALRAAAAAGDCATETHRCQIPFVPPGSGSSDNSTALADGGGGSSTGSGGSALGVILYGGGLVDPRGYAVLAERLASGYGLPAVIPVFANDLAGLGGCSTGRVELAADSFRAAGVDRWLLVGHSLGGVAASRDAWVATQNATAFDSVVAGLVLLAADVQPDAACDGGSMDFSAAAGDDDFPVAAVTATRDEVLNATRWQENAKYLPDDTLFVRIEGGNHGQFGSYNDTERVAVLGPGQVDGTATIPPEEQWELTVQAIYEIAVRTGLELPPRPGTDSGTTTTTTSAPDTIFAPTAAPTRTSGAASAAATAPWMPTALLFAATLLWATRGWTR